MRQHTLALTASAVGLFIGTSALASVTFSGTGLNPEASANASGSAKFTISGNILTVVLTNTTSPRSTAQGNAMTGVTFDINPGSPALTLTGTAMSAGSTFWTSKTTSSNSASLDGSWTSVLGGSPLGEYGVATTGFNGRFNGGSISMGNAAPNYGIVAAGTFDGTNVAFGGSQFPFIQGSMTFTFSGASGISESQIANVKLLFGTDGTGVIQTSIPSPGSVALLGFGAALASRRRRA